ncbi:MAG TPA: GGDEF domain-containing protein [Egibacteraceae bacterium]|nr:GGDEF domain-containing protein [Egibacteraceae bacterium]
MPSLTARGARTAALAALGLLLMLALLGGLLVRGQVQAREDLRTRFALRAELAAGFMDSLRTQGHDLRLAHEAAEASAHLATIVPVAGQRAYLVDRGLRVLAASPVDAVGRLLPEVEPALGAPTPGATPTYRGIHHPGEHVAASAAVGASGLMVVITVPTQRLYQPLEGAVWPQWLLFTVFAVVGAMAVLLLLRLMRREAELEWAMRVDPVTGVRNRRHLQERLPEVASASRRHGRPWALLMIDVDHFKRVNDEQGHAGGDAVLREVAAAIVAECRVEDLAGRWGGDEFLAILPDSDLDAAEHLAARIAERARRRMGAQGSLSVGCAAGLGEDPEGMLRRADAALYEAKRQGRGRVVAAAE